MSTLIPPRTAKRQRLNAEKESLIAQQLAEEGKHGPNSQTVVIQLKSKDDSLQQDSLLGPPISLPANQTGQKELQKIVNQLERLERQKSGNKKKKGKEWIPGQDSGSESDDEEEDDEDIERPFSFHVTLKDDSKEGGEVRLEINSSILTDILSNKLSTSLGLSTESILTINYSPQAIFKVKTISRCSSTLSGHSSPILCSSFSPTGNLLITGSGDKTARIWDIETETPLHVLSGHSGWVLCCEWESSERRVATGDERGEIRIWNSLDSKNGKTGRFAWGSKTGAQVEEEERQRREKDSTKMEIDEEKKEVEGEGEGEKTKIKMKASEKRALRHASPTSIILKGHSKWITSLCWEPLHLVDPQQSPRLASSSKDTTVKVWDTRTKLCQFTLGGHTASVNVVRWGGTNQGALYTASSDRTVKIWNAQNGKLIRTLDSHSHWVNTLALSTDFILKTGPFDFDYRYKPNLKDGKLVELPKQTKEEELEYEREIRKKALKRFQNATIKLGLPEIAVSGSEDSTLFLWSPQIGDSEEIDSSTSGGANSLPSPKKPLARLTGHQKSVNQVSFSPDGRLLASASFDSSIRLWDPRIITPLKFSNFQSQGIKMPNPFIRTFRGHLSSVYRLDWSADSRMLISASKDSTLKLWNVGNGKIKVDLPGHEDEVYCVGWGGTGGERGGGKVASGGKEGKVKIWRH